MTSLPEPYYQDESATIYCADCREILPLLPKVDLVLTDPPYGTANKSGWNGKLGACEISNDDSTALRDYMLEWAGNLPCIVFGSWRIKRPKCKAVLIWNKGGHSGMGDLSFPWKPNFEEIYVIGGGFSGRRTSSVLDYFINPTFNATRTHPTEKPVELIIDLMSKCPPGIILDPFMGSGTTLRAAKDLGRKAIGIEINPAYCEIAKRRLAQMVLPL